MRLGLNGEHFVVLSIASLTVNKGHAVLIRAMRLVVERHPNARCLIVGEGGERACLESLIAGLGLQGRVLLLGMQPDVSPFLRLADVVVLGSLSREGLSVSLLEGAAAGVPLIGSDLGGIPEVIRHGVNGFLFRPGDDAALAAAVKRLIEGPALRERMRRQSRSIGEGHFSPRKFISAVDGIYEELAGDEA